MERNIIGYISRFFKCNWVWAFENLLFRKYYPNYARIDAARVKTVTTDYGTFNYTEALQRFSDVFKQIDDYNIDMKSNDVVIDIGANIGAFTVRVANKVLQVVAVEPLFYNDLGANIELNGLKNVVCVPYALGVGTIEVTFQGHKDNVKCVTLDDIRKMCTPTFLKLDCEGGEWSLKPSDFEGIRAVEAEIHNFNGENPHNFRKMLQGLGFSCTYDMLDGGLMMLHARR